MQKIFLTLFCFILVSNVYAQILGATLATVRLTRTETVSQQEMEKQFDLLETQLNTRLTREQKNELLDSRINTILISQAAERERIQPTETEISNAIQVQKQSLGVQISDSEYQGLILEQTGLSWTEYREQLTNRLIQEKYILFARPNLSSSIGTPTEEEILTVYEENAANFVNPSMVGFSHIFVDTRDLSSSQESDLRRRMNSFNSRIRRGGDSEFQKIVRESLDDAAITGGDFGYVISGDQNAIGILGESFVNTVLGLSEGDITEILESNVGLHIVKITDRRRPRLLDIDDPLLPGQSITVRQNIIQYILQRKQQEAILLALEEITADLRSEADINIIQSNVNW